MKKTAIFIFCILMLFSSCSDKPEGIVMTEHLGSELEKLIEETPEGDTLTLSPGIYNLSEPLVINKAITIKGSVDDSGNPVTVFDYSGQLFDATKYEEDCKNTWLGGVNIYCDGVTLENIKIVGDLDKATEKGTVSKYYYNREHQNDEDREVYYKPVFGLYVNPLVDEAKSKPDSSSTQKGINITNVEITKSTADAVYINYVRVKNDWYSNSYEDYNEIVNAEEKGIVLSKMNIHGNGNIEKTNIGATGIFMRNSTNIILEDSYIDTGVSGAPIWIHASSYQGPFIVKNTTLAGKYLDSMDKNFCYASQNDAGNFKNLDAPIILEVNNKKDGECNAGTLIVKEEISNVNPLQIENYVDSNDMIDLDSIPQRAPLWGSTIIAFTATNS